MPSYQYDFLAERYGTRDLKALAQRLYEEESGHYPIVAIFAYGEGYEETTGIKTCSDQAEIDELYSSPYCGNIRLLFGQT
jgi:hypothetical protein